MNNRLVFAILLLTQLGCSNSLHLTTNFVSVGRDLASEEDLTAGGLSKDCSVPDSAAFYVAPDGKDSQSGELEQPFQTLDKAVLAARASTVKMIYLRGGVYPRTSPLILDSRDNGLQISGYPCENAILDGAEKLSGFRSEGNQVYSVAIASPSTFRELIVAGKRWRPAAVTPFKPEEPTTSDWLFEAGASTQEEIKAEILFNAKDLTTASFSVTEGLQVQAFAWDRQRDLVIPVRSLDFTNHKIILQTLPTFSLAGGTFRILNDPRFLRRVGEFTWSWKAAEKRLYLMADNSAVLNDVGYPRSETLVRIQSAQDISITQLQFRNTRVGEGAIVIQGGGAIRVGGNRFDNIGTAVSISQSSDNLIAGNIMDSIGEIGINITTGSSRNKIYANLIQNIGIVEKFAFGIAASGISNNVIRQNDIRNSARYGISIKNWDNATANYSNVIEYNIVDNTCLETSDGGAIETLGRNMADTKSTIRGNFIDHTYGLTGVNGGWVKGYKAFGIYLDDLSSGFTVTGNILNHPGNSSSHIFVHGGHLNMIEQNIGILTAEGSDFIRLENVTLAGSNGIPYGNTVRRNVIYGMQSFQNYFIYYTGGEVDVNDNLLFNVGRFAVNGIGQDTRSRISDPLFMDVRQNDLRLRSDSPALSMGIQQPPMDLIGVSHYRDSAEYPDFWAKSY